MAVSHVFGLTRYALTLRPGMTLSQDNLGRWTGRAEFTCFTDDFGSLQIQNKLRQGTSLSSMSDQIGSEFAFMAVDTVTSRAEPGGYSVVEVTLKGFNEEQWEFDADRTKVYTRNTSTKEESIFNHPRFIDEVPSNLLRGYIKLGIDGNLVLRGDSTTGSFVLTTPGKASEQPVIHSTTDEVFISWWVLIVTEGNHTFMNPVSEWTMNTTGKLPLTDAEIEKIGYIDDPPGNPATPPGGNWLLSGITELIQVQGEGSNSYSKTWTSSGQVPFPEEIYTKYTAP